MSGKEIEENCANVNESSALVPYQDNSALANLNFIQSFLDEVSAPSREVFLRQRFEADYAEHLTHQRRVIQPCPSQQEDPEGYKQWMESNNYLLALAQEDLYTAGIVKRLATPINDRINQNRPKEERENKWGSQIDEHGRDLWLHPKEEDEFEELDREASRSAGEEVPINRIQVLEILAALQGDVHREGEQIGMLDLIFDGRYGGEVFLADGKMVYVEPNPDRIIEYDAEVDVLKNRMQEIQEIQIRYMRLLPASDQTEWRKRNNIQEPPAISDGDI